MEAEELVSQVRSFDTSEIAAVGKSIATLLILIRVSFHEDAVRYLPTKVVPCIAFTFAVVQDDVVD